MNWNRMNTWLAPLLAAQLTLSPLASQASQPEADTRHNVLLKVTLGSIAQKYEGILSRLPDEVVNGLEVERNAELSAEIEARIAGLKDGTLTPQAIREEVLKVNRENLEGQKRELFYQLHNMDSDQLDAIAGKIERNANYSAASQEYVAAFTRSEKANVLVKAIARELDQLGTMLTKRSNFFTVNSWIKDLKANQARSATKSHDKRKWLKILGYAALGVAAVGVVTWGVASTVYGIPYLKAKSARQKEYEALRDDLEAGYNNLEARLTQEEFDYLDSHGYVWGRCGTYEVPDSIVCNGYDYAEFWGTTYCDVYCYRQPSTGKETMHSAPYCVSPFIPSDCYDPSEWDQGYADGDADGHYDGYYDGYSDGDYEGGNQGSYDGYHDGDYDGEAAGYNAGYADGFADGYASYTPSSTYLATTSTGEAYTKGFDDGKRDASILLDAGNL